MCLFVKWLLNLCSSRIILHGLKRTANAWGIQHLSVQNVWNKCTCEAKRIMMYMVLQVCQMYFSSHESCWQGALQSARFRCAIKSSALLLMIWCSFKFRGVPAPAPKSAQWGFLSHVRCSQVTETKSQNIPQQKAVPRTSLPISAPLHSISLLEDATPSLSFKAPIEM